MKSWKKPTTSQIDKAIALVAHAEQYRYFFDKLNNPMWVASLVGKKFFQTSPRIVRNDKQGTVQFPPWPESKYLVRMSGYTNVQKDIADIISKVDTDNISVIGDFLDCLVQMPKDLIVPIVPKAKSWIEKGIYWLLPEKYAKLIIHLSTLGCNKEAISLSRSLLAVQPDPRYEKKETDGYGFSFPPDVVSKFHDHDYEETLEKIVPALAKSTGFEALKMYSEILNVAITLSLTKPKESKPEDVSYIWRPAIEDNEQNHGENIKNSLITAIRETLLVIFQTDPTNSRKVLEFLKSKDWKIFQRLLLFLIDKYPKLDKDLLAKEILSEQNFLDSSLKHEYFYLLKNHFGILTKKQQQSFFEMIHKGPEVDNYKKYVKEVRGNDTSTEEVEKYINNWRLSKYYPIASYLEGADKDLYDALLKQLGEPEHPSFTSYTQAASWGPTSPKTTQEILALSSKEFTSFLKDWEPSKDMQKPSREGLGREITAMIVTNQTYFDPIISDFIELHPTYVRALLNGYNDLAKNQKKVPWDSLFTLIEWVLKQELGTSGEDYSLDEDAGWGWTRNSIVRLLSTGFQSNAYQINFKDRKKAWDIVLPFTHDSDPTEEREGKRGDKLDPASLSINTTRGEAIHAVVKYALWVRRNLEKTFSGEELNIKGFDNMPEVRAVLNEHLEIDKDPSQAVRAVYGQWLPWLKLLDTTWTKEKISMIFPSEEANKKLYDAAWDTYISLCNPYKDVIDLLTLQYEIAIKNLPNVVDSKDFYSKNSRLAQHIAVFYWIGKLELNKNSLIDLFFSIANEKLKAELIHFIGRSLEETKEDVPEIVLTRLRNLWEARIAVVTTTKETKELEGFGWWFISQKFDKDWSIKQLLDTLRLTKKIDPDHNFIPYLEAFVPDYPKEVAECISLMIEGEGEGWGLLDWGKHLRTIFALLLASNDRAAIDTTKEAINNLGKKGIFDYRDLVS